MANFSLYFTVGFIITLAVLRGRAGHLEYKVRRYIQKNYPERQKEFGCVKGGWFNEFKLIKSLYKEHGIEDQDFIILQKKARNALTCAFLVLLGGLLVLLSFLITLFVVKK